MLIQSGLRVLGVAAFVLACSGSDGKDGEDGASCGVEDNRDGTATLVCDDGSAFTIKNGEDGASAANPNSTHIVESFFCAGGLEDTVDLGFAYNAVLLSSGDMFVAGSINGSISQASATSFYAPQQNGYTTAQVLLRYDVDATADGGWFSIELDRGTLVTVISYRETGATRTPDAVWTMQPSACVHNFYD